MKTHSVNEAHSVNYVRLRIAAYNTEYRCKRVRERYDGAQDVGRRRRHSDDRNAESIPLSALSIH